MARLDVVVCLSSSVWIGKTVSRRAGLVQLTSRQVVTGMRGDGNAGTDGSGTIVVSRVGTR